MSLTRFSAEVLAAKLVAKEVSSVEVTQAHLDRISAVDGDVHAFLHISANALDTAQVLTQAPEHDGSRFKVSAILGEEQ